MKTPGTEFTWKDLSGYSSAADDEAIARPLLLAASSFDKGPEEIMTVYGNNFYKLFGENMSYERHGQPAIQAANSIDAGAELLIKRIVAEDATLANLIVTAKVTKEQTPKVDQASGAAIYIDSVTEKETTEATNSEGGANERAMITTCKIKYDVVTTTGAKTLDDVITAAKALKTEDAETDTYVYPLFVVTDNGRGASSKRVNITIDYALSKNTGFAMYSLVNLGKVGLDYEYARFSGNPDTIYLGKSYSLSAASKTMLQVRAAYVDTYADFRAKISSISGIDESDLDSIDILFGKDFKKNNIPEISIDETGYDLSAEYGLPLLSGSNGNFGDAPFGTTEYATKMTEFFDGTYDNIIFDRDRYKISACVDANYPLQVKNAITELAIYREDFVFLRDMGLDHNTFDDIMVSCAGLLAETKFAANYFQTYDIIDPFTKRQIPVTICYSLARLIVNHLNNNINAPFAGILYNMTIPEAIEGTVNILPMKTPHVDQKTDLMDNRFNYASYINNVLTVELQLTSQSAETQCTHLNNILAAQDLIRDIRTSCPAIRYTFIYQTEGLTRYAADVEKIIERHEGNFKNVTFDWTADDEQLANKFFNATLYISFYDYVQAEAFTICTIN